MKKDSRKLLRMAFLTSPLLAIYNVAPISLMINSGMITVKLPLLQDPENTYQAFIPIAFITINALIIWLFNIWLVNKSKKNNIKVGIRYLTSFLFTLLLVALLTSIGSQLRPFPHEIVSFRLYPFIGMAANNTFILIMIDLILNREKKAALEIEKANLEALNLRSRHEQLKQQIHPHFLFNALNTLKLLIKRDQDGAERYTVRLSSFLRSSILDGLQEKVSTEDDLVIFENFMELQKVRFPEALEYSCAISSETRLNSSLPVFTFQTLAENAIKHNEFSQKNPLKIEITEVDNIIRFSNNLIERSQVVESIGIGLKNLSERFSILSDKEIEVEKTEKDFVVKIKTI